MVGYDIQIWEEGDDRNGFQKEIDRKDFDNVIELYEKKLELYLEETIILGEWIRESVRSVEFMYLHGDGSRGLDLGAASNMRTLIFKWCSTVKNLVSTKSSATGAVFPLLEYLKLENLDRLEEICDIDGPMPSIFLNNLKELRLDYLPALRRFWRSGINPYPQSIFSKLSSLYVAGCGRLQSLFSSSTIMIRDSSLAQLERLEIDGCRTMEQVLLWDEEEENHIPLVFPKLKVMKLECLPSLTSFSKGIESIQFPALEEIKIKNCLLKSFAFTTSSTHESLDNDDDHAIHMFCKSDKVKFDCLSILELSYDNVDVGKVRPPQIPLGIFARLHRLKVSGFNGLKSLFSLATTERDCLSQLKKIEISSCDMMEELIKWNDEENRTKIQTTVFPELELLILDSLPRLTSLSKGIQFILPNETNISNCPLLENCVSSSTTSSDDSIHLFCKTDKVEYGSLKELRIAKYNSMKRNWCPQVSMINIFVGLHKLEISEIKGVKSLFSLSVARNLHKMRNLKIDQCDEMVGVIEADASGSETHLLPFPLFPKMERLFLNKLHKLKSFCEWRCALEFPSLTTLNILNCEVMEKFSRGPVNTPVLNNIYIDERCSLNGKDLNTLLQQHKLKREREEHNRRLEWAKWSTNDKEVEDIIQTMV